MNENNYIQTIGENKALTSRAYPHNAVTYLLKTSRPTLQAYDNIEIPVPAPPSTHLSQIHIQAFSSDI